MAVEGGMKCVKFLVFFFNFLFWICGCALIGLGIYVLVQLHNPAVFKDMSTTGAPIVIIAVGVIIFFISFFGCCGAAKENYCMVTTFAILLGLIFLVEIAAAIAGYVYRNQLQSSFKDAIETGIEQYDRNRTNNGMDDLQREFKCCGANSSSDWQPPYTGDDLPLSCCKPKAEAKVCKKGSDDVYPDGCVSILEKLFKKHIGVIAGVALGIAFFEILGVVFACCLMKGIRSGYEVM